MTNAEKIRQMKNNELATFFAEIGRNGQMEEYFFNYRCHTCKFNISGSCSKKECDFPISLVDDVRYWLDHEVREE